MTTSMTIDDLARANRPAQFSLLERAAEVFVSSPAVTRLAVRGSLAAGTADRLSDIDFIVGITDLELRRFVSVLDSLIATELGALFPGWRDTIVRRMGGLGYVYLVTNNDRLYQVDLYLVPASIAPAVERRTNAHVLHTSPIAPSGTDSSVAEFIESELARPQSCGELLVEICVIVEMLGKQINRGERFLIHAQTGLLLNALKELIKAALAPASTSWGWYHLREDLGRTPIGRTCLLELYALMAAPPIRTMDVLRSTFRRVLEIARRASPETLKADAAALDAFRHYLELA